MSRLGDGPDMTIAEVTREATRRHPWLIEALRAGVVNFAAAARFLDVGDDEAVAAALRRFADDLPALDVDRPNVRIRMRRDVDRADLAADDLLPATSADGEGEPSSLTALIVRGDVAPGHVAVVLTRLEQAGIHVSAVAAADSRATIAVPRADGARALRMVESTVTTGPAVPRD